MACGCQSKSKKQPTKVKQIMKPRTSNSTANKSALGKVARRVIRRSF